MKPTQEETLFGPPTPIARITEPKSGYAHREPCQTELKAALKQREVGGPVRIKVLGHIVDAGITGITRREISEFHGVRIPSVCSAVKRLKELGLIQVTDRERGGGAVITATVRGHRQAQRLAS